MFSAMFYLFVYIHIYIYICGDLHYVLTVDLVCEYQKMYQSTQAQASQATKSVQK